MGVLMLPFGRHVLYGLLLVCAWHIGCARADVLLLRPNIAIARIAMVAFRWHSLTRMLHIMELQGILMNCLMQRHLQSPFDSHLLY